MIEVYPKIAKRAKTDEDTVAAVMTLFFDKLKVKMEDAQSIDIKKDFNDFALVRKKKGRISPRGNADVAGSTETLKFNFNNSYFSKGLYRFTMNQVWWSDLRKRGLMDNKKYRYVG